MPANCRQSAECPASSPPSKSFAHTESSWADNFDILGSRCAKVYHDHLYFDLPVLDGPRLLRAFRSGKAPFPPDSLLHHAFVAATAPWLTQDLLELEGCSQKDEVVVYHIEKFERLLAITAAQGSLEQSQALLLAISALRDNATSNSRAKTSRWLSIVISNIRQPEPTASRSRPVLLSTLRRRVWWTAYTCERLFHLRHDFEEKRHPHPPTLKLDARDGDSISVDDFDLELLVSSNGSNYWARMQRASFFLQRTTLFSHMDMLVAENHWLPQSQSRLLMPPPSQRARLQPDEYAERLHSLFEQFENLSMAYVCLDSEDTRDNESIRGVEESRLTLQLTFGRVLMVLCQFPLAKPQSNGGSLVLLDPAPTIMIKTIRQLLTLAENALNSSKGGLLSEAFSERLLRPLVVCSRTLVSMPGLKNYAALEVQQLKRQSRQLLQECLCVQGYESVDSNGRSEVAPTSQDVPGLSSAASTTTDTLTPTSFSIAPTPADERGEVWSKEPVTEEQELLWSFDDMWNKHLVTAKSPGLLMPELQGAFGRGGNHATS